jgi:hypothetical protein
LVILGCLSDARGSIYSLTPSEQLFVTLSNQLVMSQPTTIFGDVGLGGAGASVNIQNTSFVKPLSPYTGTADFSGATSCSNTGCPPATNIAGALQANVASVTTAINDYNNLVTTLTGIKRRY